MKQSFIIAFVLWHATAVFLTSAPDAMLPKAFASMIARGTPLRSYMLLTSQWQDWPLFAPNPTTDVVAFAVERENENAWTMLRRIDPDGIPWFKRSVEMKIVRRLEEQDEPELYRHYLLAFCKDAAPQAILRLRVRTSTMHLRGVAAPLRWKDRIAASLTCPSA